jgi:uncharacterized protein YhdP
MSFTSMNDFFKKRYFNKQYVDTYWQEVEPTLKLHQLLWEMPENTEYVIKNGQLIWRVRG